MRISARRVLLCLLFPLAACASHQALPYDVDQDPQSALASMQNVQKRALQNNKKVMYVLGANWCHDSVDFASMLEEPDAAALLASRYEVQFINVGYLEHIRQYVELFDVPVIYGTPTVMIVDPGTGTLLNRDTLSTWRNASTRNAEDVRAYLALYALQKPAAESAGQSQALQMALSTIDDFEQRQAERIYAAYEILGPLLKAQVAGEPAPGFQDKWSNVAAMRSVITKDLAKLRQSARAQDAVGATDIKLIFPEYSLF